MPQHAKHDRFIVCVKLQIFKTQSQEVQENSMTINIGYVRSAYLQDEPIQLLVSI